MVANHDEGWRLVGRNTLNLRKAWLGLRAIRVNYGGHAYIAYTSGSWPYGSAVFKPQAAGTNMPPYVYLFAANGWRSICS